MKKKPLSIPARKRGPYQYVYCNKCKKTVNQTCGKTGKKLSVCKDAKAHRFIVLIHVPGTSHGTIRETFETRDFDTFRKQAQDFVQECEEMGLVNVYNARAVERTRKKQRKVQPDPAKLAPLQNREIAPAEGGKSLLLLDNIEMYIDWLSDVDVLPHERKGLEPEYIKEHARSLDKFCRAIKSYEKDGYSVYDLATFLVTNIGKREVGVFYAWLELPKEDGTERAPSSFNKTIYYMKAFVEFLQNQQKLEIPNYFADVKHKAVPKKDIKIIDLDEFDRLLKVITPENGKYMIWDRGKMRPRTHYKPWLRHCFRLFLETGERRDGIVHLKWSDIKQKFIEIRNHKVSKAKKTEVLRKCPLTKSLGNLLLEMGYEQQKGSDRYLIAPDHKNRNNLKLMISKAFGHYWQKAGFEAERSLMHLRKTYATLMVTLFGDQAKHITGHADIEVIINHYFSEAKIIDMAVGVTLDELSERTQFDHGVA